LTWWSIPRRAWVIILAELAVIVIFGAGFYSEYLNNLSFQAYANSLAPVLIPVLSVAFGVSSATVAIFLYFGMRKITQSGETDIEAPTRKKPQSKRTIRKSSGVAGPKSVKAVVEPSDGLPRPRFIIGPASTSQKVTETGSGKKDPE